MQAAVLPGYNKELTVATAMPLPEFFKQCAHVIRTLYSRFLVHMEAVGKTVKEWIAGCTQGDSGLRAGLTS